MDLQVKKIKETVTQQFAEVFSAIQSLLDLSIVVTDTDVTANQINSHASKVRVDQVNCLYASHQQTQRVHEP